MGGCTTSAEDKGENNKVQFDKQPADTVSLEKKKLPILDFYVLLTDVKVKKCLLSSIGFKFRIDGVTQYTCPPKQLDKNNKSSWNIKHCFDFMMTEYDVRKKFVIIEATNSKKEIVGRLTINLYIIWAGPYHQDFIMILDDRQSCRVSFNFKMSQGIHLKLSNLLTNYIPMEPKSIGTRLTFAMETMIGQKSEPSSYAYNICVQESKGKSKGLIGDLPQATNVRKQKIIWQQNQSKEAEMPAVNQKLAFYQLYSSSLHFTFWRVEPGIIDASQPRYQYEGGCYIPFSKLLGEDYQTTVDPITNIPYLKRSIQKTEKLYKHGKEIGKAQIKLHFLIQAYQKQMQACVRTQEGILTSTPIFNAGHSEECQQIKQLSTLNSKIERQFINLDEQTEKNAKYLTLKVIVLKISKYLQQELTVLEKTEKESILMYKYRNETDLLKAQRFLVFFGYKVLSFIHEDIAFLKETCWDILATILKRGEFKLSHLGFSKQEQRALAEDDLNDNLKLKKEIGLKYLELMNQLLKQTLQSLYLKGDQAEQSFAQKFCAYAYFRVPLFREHILQTIKKQKDPEIPEWRGTEANLYDYDTTRRNEDDFYDLFDWENNFLKPLSKQQTYKGININLQKVLMEDRWKLRLANRQGAFYRFLQNLVTEIEYVSVISKYIDWHHLPGYNRLLHAFLSQMKKTKIRNYTESFRNCVVGMLVNEKLLNVMVVIILTRSNVNDPDAVALSFELIDELFKCIQKNNRSIPATFDIKFLLKGMKMVLESQFEFSISKVLLFFYDNFNILPQQLILELSLYLLTKWFYRFFFHWSFNLRNIFHTLLYCKISRYDHSRQHFVIVRNNSETNYFSSLKQALHERYEDLLNQIRQQIEPRVSNRNCHNRYQQKQLYKIMRTKLKNRANKHNNGAKRNMDEPGRYLFPSSKSSGQSRSKLFQPKKLLYFVAQDMKLEEMQSDQLNYVKVSLEEFNETIRNLKEQLEKDPKFTPEIKIKRLTDDLDNSLTNQEEW